MEASRARRFPAHPARLGTYTVVANFPGSTDYTSATSTPTTFTISQATPTVTVSDAGGTYNGSTFPATALVAGVVSGVDNTPASSLETISPTLTYYAGSSATGPTLAGAPIVAGTYTVVASFSGSTDYTSASSSPVTFTITQATPTVTVNDAGGTYNGSAFPATSLVAGVVSGVDNTPASSLETVSPTLTYYAGTSTTGPTLVRRIPLLLARILLWPVSPAAPITPRPAAVR